MPDESKLANAVLRTARENPGPVADALMDILKTAGPSADVVYQKRVMEVKQLLVAIASGLKKHTRDQSTNPANWGYVGDMAEVAELLGRAKDFLSGQG